VKTAAGITGEIMTIPNEVITSFPLPEGVS
jgi:hypothetical protein